MPEYYGIWRNITEYAGISRNITEYHGISRNMPEYYGISRHFPEYTGTSQYFPMVAMRLFINIGRLTTFFITKVMDISHFDGKKQTITLYWKFYMSFISLLRKLWINNINSLRYSVLKNNSADVQNYFRTRSELCYTQNLVNNSLFKTGLFTWYKQEFKHLASNLPLF
jgi:hypothetical protein